MDNQRLYHHGILGMKWGVRRFQNKDGTLTAAGKRRLNNSVSYDDSGHIRDKDSNKATGKIHGEVANDYKNVSSALHSVSDTANSLKNISDHVGNNKRTRDMKNINTTQMSDQELRERINRMNMEKQYRSLMTEDIDSGSKYVSNILSTVGDVVTVAASAASIAVAIHTLRK